MRLVTVATHSDGYYDFLIKSCQRFNVKIDVLGYGEKWQGFGWRMNLVQNYVDSIEDENEVICFIDAYDVLLLRPIDEMEILFRVFAEKTGTNIVIGHEKHISIFIHILGKIIFGDCDGLAINAGTFIGFKSAISDMIKTVKSYNDSLDSDDQILITKYATKNIRKIHIDTECNFFLTIANQLSNFDIESVVIKNKTVSYKGLKPFFAHGCGNTNMNSFIEKLGYKMTLYEKNKKDEWNYDSSIKKIIYYCKNYSVYLVLILCLIIYYIAKLFR